MAVKWMVANGLFANASVWNGGSVPQDGDIMYLNGHSLGFSNGYILNMPNSILTNEICPNTGTGGGAIYVDNAFSLILSQIRNYQVELFLFAAPKNVSITSDVYLSNIAGVALAIISYSGVNSPFTINGNIYTNNGTLINFGSNTGGYTVTINGNIDKIDHIFLKRNNQVGSVLTINGNVGNVTEEFCNYLTNVAINGNVSISNDISLINNFIAGNINITNNSTVYCSSLTISGGITYSGTNPDRGLMTATIYINNPATFYWINTYEYADYPAENDVKQGVAYDWGQKVGTYTPDYPQEAEVLQGVTYDNGNKTGTLTPVILGDYPAEADVKVGVVFDYGNKVGTFQPVADYPAEADVLQGVEYAYGQMTGTLSVATDYPQEANVLQGVEYANGSMVGTLEVVQMPADYPSEDDVRFDVPFDFGNKLGKCHVPIPEDVRDGVPVDVNDVGTLIPSSGGDRLRIADFGYYTNAQSDTYIVDLTEQDKPKFAVAEERVLIEMFPDLDLDNIPDKYFDDLFVKYLKYRLIVEYYRTAGINSTFTPSEPTTEIVNYQNVRNEVWLNSANIYLKAWAKKYPESITKPQRILL